MINWLTNELLLRKMSNSIPSVRSLKQPARRSLESGLKNYLDGRKLRERQYRESGVRVPAVFSLQMLTACNLRCEGCHVSGGDVPETFDRALYSSYLAEMEKAGCRMVLLIGGEPMILADEVFSMAENFPKITFLLFTNGTLWTTNRIERLMGLPNLVPMLSFEGEKALTEDRRGVMAFARSQDFQAELSIRNIFHGISVMIHDRNVDHVENAGFLENLFPTPHNFTFFMAYTARGACSSFSPVQPKRLESFYRSVVKRRKEHGSPMLFLPHDEMEFLEGCGGARLLVHMNSDASLALCPYTYDDVIGRPAAGEIMKTLSEVQKRIGVDSSCSGLQANSPYYSNVVPIYPVN
jgi:organic radical activating enzyme